MGKQWVVAFGRADMAIGPFDNETLAESVNIAIGGDGVVELCGYDTLTKVMNALNDPAGTHAAKHFTPAGISNIATATGRIPSDTPSISNTPKSDIPPWES